MKKKAKIILIISIVIASIAILGTIFGIVDYNRVMKGEDPIFSKSRLSYQFFDVTPIGEYEEPKENNNHAATIYYGLGYKLVACDFCENSVYIMPFGVGTYPFSVLTCTQDSTINDKSILKYTFMDGRLDTISTTHIIKDEDITDEESYRKEFNKINDVTGCWGDFTKNTNLSGVVSYTAVKGCDLSKMSDNDIQTIYKTDRDLLEQTRDEIINNHKKDNPTMKCEESIAE